MNFEATIEINDEEVLLEIEAVYQQADPDVGYDSPWIEIESATDCKGVDVWRKLNAQQQAEIENRAWDEVECIKEERQLARGSYS